MDLFSLCNESQKCICGQPYLWVNHGEIYTFATNGRVILVLRGLRGPFLHAERADVALLLPVVQTPMEELALVLWDEWRSWIGPVDPREMCSICQGSGKVVRGFF